MKGDRQRKRQARQSRHRLAEEAHAHRVKLRENADAEVAAVTVFARQGGVSHALVFRADVGDGQAVSAQLQALDARLYDPGERDPYDVATNADPPHRLVLDCTGEVLTGQQEEPYSQVLADAVALLDRLAASTIEDQTFNAEVRDMRRRLVPIANALEGR